MNSPDCMVQDQSVNNTWKNLVGGLYDTFNKRKPSRQTMGGFMNDIQASFENLSQEKIHTAIDMHSAKSNGSDYCCWWWSYYLNMQWICKKRGGGDFMIFSTYYRAAR